MVRRRISAVTSYPLLGVDWFQILSNKVKYLVMVKCSLSINAHFRRYYTYSKDNRHYLFTCFRVMAVGGVSWEEEGPSSEARCLGVLY